MMKSSLTQDQKNEQIFILEQLIQLKQSPIWATYAKAVEREIETQLPGSGIVDGVDGAIRMASRLAYVNGLKRALNIVNQEKRLAEMKAGQQKQL